MEQLRLVQQPTAAPRRRARRKVVAAPVTWAADWKLDPRLRQVGRRRVVEARRILAEARNELARAS